MYCLTLHQSTNAGDIREAQAAYSMTVQLNLAGRNLNVKVTTTISESNIRKCYIPTK